MTWSEWLAFYILTFAAALYFHRRRGRVVRLDGHLRGHVLDPVASQDSSINSLWSSH